MKLEDIHTKEQFNEMSEIFYKRAGKIKKAWLSNKNYDNQVKAFKIYMLLRKITSRLIKSAIKLNNTGEIDVNIFDK